MQVNRIQSNNYNTSFNAKWTHANHNISRKRIKGLAATALSVGAMKDLLKPKADISPEKQRRQEVVDEYLAKRGPRDDSERIEDPFKDVSLDIPLGVQVNSLGDNVSEIDKKYGLHGLYTYVKLAEREPDTTPSVSMWLDDLLLNKCKNGGSVSLKEIHERLGDYGIDLYESPYYRLYVETYGVFEERCRISEDNYEHLRVSAVAKRVLYNKKLAQR